MTSIPAEEGRRLFGGNVDAYDQARPEYPQPLFDLMSQRRAIYPGARTLEIGPGNGLATKPLARRGAHPLTLVEPGRRFASRLAALRDFEGHACGILNTPLEGAGLAGSTFDLVVAATSFHWLHPDTRVSLLADITAPGATVALLWNVFQIPGLTDPFHDATHELLAHLASGPSGEPGSLPFALDRRAREAEFRRSGAFESSLYAERRWRLRLDPDGVRSLYESFSNIARLSDAQRCDVLDQLQAIAATRFGGRVERNVTSPLYLFQRL